MEFKDTKTDEIIKNLVDGLASISQGVRIIGSYAAFWLNSVF